MIQTPNADAIKKAAEAVMDWQKYISDHSYADIRKHQNPESRFDAQKRIVSAGLHSSESYLDEMLDQFGSDEISDALDAVPSLTQQIQPHELAHPNWETDKCIYDSMKSGACSRGQASNLGYWHLITLRQIRDQKLPDPPAYLLCQGITGALPVNRAVLDRDYVSTSESDRKALDAAIRNLLRHSGGIFHRKKNFLINAALPSAWWRVETAVSAAHAACGLSTKEVYEALRPAWKKWADKAAWSSTRLAAPNTVAAFALIAHDHAHTHGALPTGSAVDEITTTLMRRTLHLSVTHVSPKDLASLVA